MAGFLRSLPSTHSFIVPTAGHKVTPSENLIGFIGIVFLLNDARDQLYRDMKTIRAVENKCFYTLSKE